MRFIKCGYKMHRPILYVTLAVAVSENPLIIRLNMNKIDYYLGKVPMYAYVSIQSKRASGICGRSEREILQDEILWSL